MEKREFVRNPVHHCRNHNQQRGNEKQFEMTLDEREPPQIPGLFSSVFSTDILSTVSLIK